MTALRDIQSAFRRALLEGDGAEIAPLIREDGIFSDERLAVYRSNMVASITAALREIYPVVERLVGERFFDHAALEFLCARPPESPSLNTYGAAFADFLVDFPPARDLVYLADVARLEWKMHRAALVPETAALEPSALAQLAAEELPRLVIRLHPAMGYLASPWPIDLIWNANRPGAPGGEAINLDFGGAHLEVGRRGGEVRCRALADGIFGFRNALSLGLTLEAATEAALAADPGFKFAPAFAELFRDGIPVGIVLSSA